MLVPGQHFILLIGFGTANSYQYEWHLYQPLFLPRHIWGHSVPAFFETWGNIAPTISCLENRFLQSFGLRSTSILVAQLRTWRNLIVRCTRGTRRISYISHFTELLPGLSHLIQYDYPANPHQCYLFSVPISCSVLYRPLVGNTETPVSVPGRLGGPPPGGFYPNSIRISCIFLRTASTNVLRPIPPSINFDILLSATIEGGDRASSGSQSR